MPRPRTCTRRGLGYELSEKALSYTLDVHARYEIGTQSIRCITDMPVEQRAKRGS